jgi:hypothetical protein
MCVCVCVCRWGGGWRVEEKKGKPGEGKPVQVAWVTSNPVCFWNADHSTSDHTRPCLSQAKTSLLPCSSHCDHCDQAAPVWGKVCWYQDLSLCGLGFSGSHDRVLCSPCGPKVGEEERDSAGLAALAPPGHRRVRGHVELGTRQAVVTKDLNKHSSAGKGFVVW